ncbi:P-loop NTPase fold protein [uncultured Megamonas sp.]|uniref:KAP family P-loop NTPase fold protein n=1 Tax=uncultured Megamonas sp. TaxID=286140 RepID=UPI003390676D
MINFIRLLDSIKSNFSIAIDNDWGTGKTFFVKEVKMILDAYNEHSYDYELSNLERIKNVIDIKNIDLHLAVYYNAWENDNQKSPLLSLIYEIIKVAKIDTNKTDISINKEKIIKDGLSAIVKHFSGIDIKELLKCVETEAKDIFKEIKGQKSIKEQVDNILNNLLLEHGERLVIFIDELDRCRPTFAVELLEQIKHYFDNDKITFVFSTNIKQLQYTIKKYYGEAFEAKRYLDKFFDLTISLNEINVIEYFNFVNENSRGDMYDYVCKEIVKEYNFTLRDVIKFVQINKICIENLRKTKNEYLYFDEKNIRYVLTYVLPIVIGLKIKRYDQYEDFITGKDSTPLITILSKSEWISYGIDKLFSENEKSSKDINIIKEKLELMYKAIFIEEYIDKHSIEIGKLEFTKETRKILFEAEGLLSRFARYN